MVYGEFFHLMGTTRQQVLLETLAARQRAAELLKQLEQAQQECNGCLRSDQRQDLVKQVTGKSSIETAMASAKRMIEMLDRALEEAGKGGTDGELRVEVVARIGMVSPRMHYLDGFARTGTVYVGYIGPHLTTTRS